MRRCAHCGQVLTCASGKKFGTAQRHTTSAVRMMPSAFQRVKYNIELTRQIDEGAAPKSSEQASRSRRVPLRDQLADESSLATSFAGSPLARTPEIIWRI